MKSFIEEFQPKKLVPSLTAGLIVGITDVSFEISLAALIFSGVLAPFVAYGIGFVLFGAFVILLFGALTSSIPGTITIPQDTPAAILALIVAGVAGNMPASTTLDQTFITAVTAVIVTSVLAGLTFILFGQFKLSGFARFIPYPVVGGFLAGTGWLLAKGGLSVMVDMPLTLENLPRLFQTDNLLHLLPGIIFALVLLLLIRRTSHSLVIPGMLVLSIGIFYIFLAIAGISASQATEMGWLLGPFEQKALFQPLGLSALAQVNWSAIFSQVDKIGAVIALSLISLLLNVSALEVAAKEDIDMNRELQSAGLANVVAGLFGSTVGYQALSLTVLTHRLNAKTRLAGVFTALVCGGALLFGASLLSYFPKPMMGGILLFMGLSFLVEWVIDARAHLPRIDYVLVLMILIAIASIGFLEGIAIGVLAAVVMFVVSYSQINAVKHTLSGENYRSKVERPLAHRQILQKKGGEIFILRLQGFIFFGTAQKLLDRIKKRLNDPAYPRLHYVILDFRQVVLLDSSAVFSIMRMKQLADTYKIHMVWTNLSPAIIRLMEKGGLVGEEDDSFVILPTLDHGLEWCENQILSYHGITDLTGVFEKIERQLKQAIPDLKDVRRLTKYLKKLDLKDGEYLIHQGDQPDEMYFIEAGLVTAQLELPDGKIMRLRSMRGETTVGEMGMYLGNTRTASVVAERTSIVYRLSKNALKEMEKKDPEVAALLHQWIASLLAERLAENNRTIEALLD
ncbi:MAG: SulP family inorganic anion transporter [Anaerolineales bacterium]